MKIKLKSFFLNLKLKHKLILIILLCILIQNLVLLLFSNQLLYRKEIKTIKQHLQNECFLIENQFEAEYLNTVLCSNELIKNINQLANANTSRTSFKNLLESSFRYNLHLFPFLDSILFYNQQGELIHTETENIPDTDALHQNLLSKIPDKGVPQNTFLDIALRPYTGTHSEPVLTFCKRVIHIDSGKTLGYLILNIRENDLSSLFTTSGQHYFLIDRNGIIASSTEKKELFTSVTKELFSLIHDRTDGNTSLKIHNQSYLFTWIALNDFNYTLINQTPHSDINTNIRYNTYLILTVCFLTLITISLLITMFSHMVTDPLEYLTAKIHEVEQGDFTTCSHLSRKDELGDISDSFNQMVQKLGKLTDDIKTEQEQKRKYELSLIQSQINPHFFYNVLDLIYVMCFQKETSDAASVTKYLANYYRGSLSSGKEFITLKEEFNIVASYLSIQKYRYDSILDYELNLQPSVENWLIPKMTLQPLVENALYHGLKESSQKGLISVSGHRNNSYIFLRVSDNGTGMSESFLQNILLSEGRQDHFGLQSVISRMQLYYSNRFRFRIFTHPGKGTTIILRISDMAL